MIYVVCASLGMLMQLAIFLILPSPLVWWYATMVPTIGLCVPLVVLWVLNRRKTLTKENENTNGYKKQRSQRGLLLGKRIGGRYHAQHPDANKTIIRGAGRAEQRPAA